MSEHEDYLTRCGMVNEPETISDGSEENPFTDEWLSGINRPLFNGVFNGVFNLPNDHDHLPTGWDGIINDGAVDMSNEIRREIDEDILNSLRVSERGSNVDSLGITGSITANTLAVSEGYTNTTASAIDNNTINNVHRINSLPWTPTEGESIIRNDGTEWFYDGWDWTRDEDYLGNEEYL
jgi:hypothetical protein